MNDGSHDEGTEDGDEELDGDPCSALVGALGLRAGGAAPGEKADDDGEPDGLWDREGRDSRECGGDEPVPQHLQDEAAPDDHGDGDQHAEGRTSQNHPGRCARR